MLVHRVSQWTLAAALLVGTLVLGSCAFVGRVSETADGTQGNNSAVASSASDDGRYVAFASTASNLVAGDTNGTTDVFVKDQLDKSIERVSVASGGGQADGLSYQPAISGDGRFVAFSSIATNLVGSDANPLFDVYLHDRQTGTTTLVSTNDTGTQLAGGSADQPDIDDNGRFVAFRWNPVSGTDQVYRHDTVFGTSLLMSNEIVWAFFPPIPDYFLIPGSADSRAPSISANGSLVAFESLADLTGIGIDTNGTWDVYVSMDASTVSDNPGGAPTPVTLSGPSRAPDVEGYVNDVSGLDWRGLAVFESTATTLTDDDNGSTKDVFAYRPTTQGSQTFLVSDPGTTGGADGPSATATVSEDLRWVGYRTDATNLVPGDTNGETDVLVHDRFEDRTLRVSAGPLGNQSNDRSYSPVITGDGRYAVFTTDATNLAKPDTNDRSDVIVRHVLTPSVTSVVPSALAPGSMTTVTVTGTEYDEGTVLLDSDGPFTFGTPIVDPSGTQLTVVVSIPAGAAAGVYDLLVLLAGTGPGAAKGGLGLCLDCLTIP